MPGQQPPGTGAPGQPPPPGYQQAGVPGKPPPPPGYQQAGVPGQPPPPPGYTPGMEQGNQNRYLQNIGITRGVGAENLPPAQVSKGM